MSVFIQAVSMWVTKEQYEKDLKEHLLSMGYRPLNMKFYKNRKTLISNSLKWRIGYVVDTGHNRIDSYGRYFIDHYNPKLFLEMASMTEDKLIQLMIEASKLK